MKKRFLFVTLLLFVASFMMISLNTTPVAYAKSSDTVISLKGSAKFPAAKGKAKFRDRGGEKEFQVEVENVKIAAGTKLNVFVGGKKVGTMKINQFGAGRLNLNSTRGDKVPAVSSGTKVQVKTGADVVVAAGSF